MESNNPNELSLNSGLIYNALKNNPDVKIIKEVPAAATWLCECNDRFFVVRGKSLPLNDVSVTKITKDKLLSKFAFNHYGVPTAEELVLDNTEDVTEEIAREKISNFLNEHGKILAKPKNGSESHLVHPGMTTVERALEAWRDITTHVLDSGKKYEGVLFERHLEGNLYRCTFVGTKLVAVALRDYVKVTGDGKQTVSQLLMPLRKYYAEERKQTGKPLPSEEDEKMIKVLESQGFGWDSIPEVGQVVKFTEIPDPGFIVNIPLTEVDPGTKQELESFCRHIDLNYGGFDIMSADITKPGYHAIEMNGLPDLDVHHFPDQGEGVDIAKLMVEALVKKLGGPS